MAGVNTKQYSGLRSTETTPMDGCMYYVGCVVRHWRMNEINIGYAEPEFLCHSTILNKTRFAPPTPSNLDAPKFYIDALRKVPFVTLPWRTPK